MLLDEINKLDDYLYGGGQKNERNVAVYIQHLLSSLGMSLDRDFVSANLPTVLRNVPISLKNESAKKVFKFLSSVQQSTDMDILFISAPSLFGHRSNTNYYVEVEMLQREDLAVHRLLDFRSFCTYKRIELHPILVTNFRKTEFYQDCVCILPIQELKRMAGHSVRLVNNVHDIPGIAWDNAASCFYILDILTQEIKTSQSALLEKLKGSSFLWRKELNLKRLMRPLTNLKSSLKQEAGDFFVKRINKYISTLKEKELMKDTPYKKACQITYEGSKYILRWRGSVSSLAQI